MNASTFIIEALRLVICAQLLKVMSYTVLAWDWLLTLFNSEATPTNNIDYTCHVKVAELVSVIIWGLYHATSY